MFDHQSARYFVQNGPTVVTQVSLWARHVNVRINWVFADGESSIWARWRALSSDPVSIPPATHLKDPDLVAMLRGYLDRVTTDRMVELENKADKGAGVYCPVEAPPVPLFDLIRETVPAFDGFMTRHEDPTSRTEEQERLHKLWCSEHSERFAVNSCLTGWLNERLRKPFVRCVRSFYDMELSDFIPTTGVVFYTTCCRLALLCEELQLAPPAHWFKFVPKEAQELFTDHQRLSAISDGLLDPAPIPI